MPRTRSQTSTASSGHPIIRTPRRQPTLRPAPPPVETRLLLQVPRSHHLLTNSIRNPRLKDDLRHSANHPPLLVPNGVEPKFRLQLDTYFQMTELFKHVQVMFNMYLPLLKHFDLSFIALEQSLAATAPPAFFQTYYTGTFEDALGQTPVLPGQSYAPVDKIPMYGPINLANGTPYYHPERPRAWTESPVPVPPREPTPPCPDWNFTIPNEATCEEAWRYPKHECPFCHINYTCPAHCSYVPYVPEGTISFTSTGYPILHGSKPFVSNRHMPLVNGITSPATVGHGRLSASPPPRSPLRSQHPSTPAPTSPPALPPPPPPEYSPGFI